MAAQIAMAKEKANAKTEKLEEKILLRPSTLAGDKALAEKAAGFCEGYKSFLNGGKTEREAAGQAKALLEKGGYKPYRPGKKYKAGDKLYVLNRKKAVIALTLGQKSLEDGLRFSIAHIDSPRLDLKPNPLYEADDIAYLKTHYYGGVRKYQWVAIPLSMHGTVIDADGKEIVICIGEEEGDPVFTITDLLPHLSAEQNKRTLKEGIKGEELNIVLGSLPYADEGAKNRVKLETMRLINEKYGFTERDFVRAEIEFVPAFKARDIGFDRSLLGAYGQDDRVCAYTALMAEIHTKSPQKTTVCVLTDKEETGSEGNTGLAAEYLFHFIEDLCEGQGAAYRKALANSFCISADVNAAFDPTFPSPFEKTNSCFIGKGAVVTKYTGTAGKNSTSDASAETVAHITNLFDREGVAWQCGELGKVDEGGGGTIAKFVARKNVDVIDLGVPVLSMHSPFEITSKLDIYSIYLGFCAFNTNQ